MCCSHYQLLFIPHAIFPYMGHVILVCGPGTSTGTTRAHTGRPRSSSTMSVYECFRYISWRLHRQVSFSSIGCCEIAAVQSRPPWLQNPDAGAGVYSCDVSPGHELVCNGNWSSGLAPASCARRPRLNSHRCSTLRGKLSVS